MILLGLLLLGATAAFTGLLIAYNLSGGPQYSVTVFGSTIATMSSLEIFLSGLALALLFCLALAMTAVGDKLRRRRLTELRLARRHAAASGRGRVRARTAPAPGGEAATKSRARTTVKARFYRQLIGR